MSEWLSKLIAKRNATKTLSGVAILWKNDSPQGAGIVVCSNDCMALSEHVEETVKFYEAAYEGEADKPGLIASYMKQLEQYASLDGDGRSENWLFFFGIIHTLIKYGYLDDDEYNGIIYDYQLTKATSNATKKCESGPIHSGSRVHT